MKLTELLWVIKVCNMGSLDELKITGVTDGLIIYNSSKRIDIWNQINNSCNGFDTYIRIYSDPKDLSSYSQHKFDDFLKNTELNYVKTTNSNKHLHRLLFDLQE